MPGKANGELKCTAVSQCSQCILLMKSVPYCFRCNNISTIFLGGCIVKEQKHSDVSQPKNLPLWFKLQRLICL